MSSQLSQEQQAVINHPRGKHARVLAVAGAGKTTTMVHRIQHLVTHERMLPKQICILMFNRRARVQFKEKLKELLPLQYHPQVHTFHSYAYTLISDAVTRGLLPSIENTWVGDKEELVRITVHQAIENLVRNKLLPPDSVDIDDVIECIGLWKGSLIPPERAGHHNSLTLPLIYKEFEKLRLQKNAITFDDFVPIAVGMLEAEPAVSRQIINSFECVIVDEYQDVNYGQQRLLELVSGQRADIMVVGDDDQTIYEWRGARPGYIVRHFSQVFSNKPTLDYRLSHTFRFGPLIAQCAQNVIIFNGERVPKPLIAHHANKPASILIFRDTSEQPTDTNKELAQQVLTLVRQTGDPQNIIVLGRMFSQLTGLEVEFLQQKIPYRVLGRAPFFERREIVVLLDYLRLAMALDYPIRQQTLNWLLSVANVPNRKLSKDILSRHIKQQAEAGFSLRYALNSLANSGASLLSQKQREKIEELVNILIGLNESIDAQYFADDLLKGLITTLDYHSHFDDYYGKGEASEDRKRSVAAFCRYAETLQKNVPDFLTHIQHLDTTRGVPEEQQIVMTTVFRVKGEEFDYVFLPNCEDGYMPCSFASANAIYDKAGIVKEPPISELIENERRLFYVAITRAKKGVYIGVSSAPRQGSQSTSTPTLESQFLEEIQYEPTQTVIDAFQKALGGHSNAEQILITAVKRYAARKPIMDNLLNAYLPMYNLELPDGVKHQIMSTTPYEFKYTANPKPQAAPVWETSVNWWEDDDL